MKKYKETWVDAPWYGDSINELASKRYCRLKLRPGAGEPPITDITIPVQLAYRLVEYCRQLNYCNRYYINVNKNVVTIDSFLVEVHREFRSWGTVKNIRKLIYG